MIIYRVEDSILVGLLLLMIVMAVLQVFLRNFFGTGIVWSDVLVRVLVLWVGLMGAMVASRQGNHINIDIMERYLSGRVKIVVKFVVGLFTAVICLVTAYYSLQFVQSEFIYGGESFAKVPIWLCESIIPFAFMVISLRYFLLSFINFKNIIEFRS
ncbi:MAG: TRAP transporter small permease subunit [Deltaproteobacteria bacterium]|nr:TRAP transporter small permease subunit [Deltaproteobacteria bacterium]